MTRKRVSDEQFGQLSRRADEVKRRVDEGTVPFGRAMNGLQLITEGRDLMLGDPATVIAELDGFKRLQLDPERPLESWRQILKIENRDWSDWSDRLALQFDKPELWETGLSEILYAFEKPNRSVWSLEMVGAMMVRGTLPFSLRMGLALALEDGRAGLDYVIPLIGSARKDSGGYLNVPCLREDDGRRCADVRWHCDDEWDEGCQFPGYKLLHASVR